MRTSGVRFGILAVWVLAISACSGPWGAAVKPQSPDALAAAAPIGRLSDAARPDAYRVALDIDPREAGFSGRVEIDTRFKAPADGVWLHSDDINVKAVKVKVRGKEFDATWTDVLPTGVAWVQFPKTLKAKQATLIIDYDAQFDVTLSGLFKVDENGDAYALAKSESIQARRFLPSFDEPGLKAPFKFSMTIPDGMHAIHNTPEVSRAPAREGFVTVDFKETRPLSTYLLSVAVGNFDKVDYAAIPPNALRAEPIPLTGYARRGKGKELEFALSLTPAYVLALEEAFQQPYPYEKLDIVAAPQWPSGATELAGAITYREGRILRNEATGSAQILALKQIHVHELAHMWFGNLVTPPWWDDLWLKESFATWSEPMLLSIVEPEAGHDVEAVIEGLKAMSLDRLAAVRPVSGPIARNEDIRNAYDAITYQKGMAVIRMVDTYFGAEKFRPALGRYVAEFADGEADSADFFGVIGKVTNEPRIENVFRSFVTQQGLPLIEATVSCTPNGVDVGLKQSRFKPLGSPIQNETLWTVPVCVSAYAKGETRDQCTLLDRKEGGVAFEGMACPDYVMPNKQGAGYFRFGLEAEQWRKMLNGVTNLPTAEALVTLDSAKAAFETGKLDGETYVNLLVRASGHTDRRVASAVMKIVREFPQPPASRAAAQDEAWFKANALMPMMMKAHGQSGLPFDELTAFHALEAKTTEQRRVREDLFQRLKAYMAGASGEFEPLTSDLYVPALTIALERGGTGIVGAILDSEAARDDSSFSAAVGSALSRVKDPAQQAMVRDLVAKGTLGGQATIVLAQGQMETDTGREAMWAMLKADFPAYLEKLPAQSRRGAPRLAQGFCDPARAGEVKALFETHGALAEGHQQALAETLESLSVCAATRTQARAELDEGLAALVRKSIQLE